MEEIAIEISARGRVPFLLSVRIHDMETIYIGEKQQGCPLDEGVGTANVLALK